MALAPVRLDPFQNIVNVHWATKTHVAFQVSLTCENTHSANVACDSPIDEQGGHAYTSGYMDRTTFRYKTPPPTNLSTILVWDTKSETWESSDGTDEATISGVPE